MKLRNSYSDSDLNFHLPIAHGEFSGSGLHLPSLSHVITTSLLMVEYIILWHESMICVPGAWLNAESLMLKDK